MAVDQLDNIYTNSKAESVPTRKRRFMKDALILTVIVIVMRAVGTAFMIYISNMIGAEGIGLYQLTSSVYLLFITISTSGISLAVTRIVSEQVAMRNTIAAKSAFKNCLFISIIISIIAGFLLFFLAEPLGVQVVKDTRTIVALKLLAFSLPFLSIGSAIRGYFLGLQKGVKAASTDIVEQLVQIIVTIPILVYAVPKGLEAACCGLIIGATISEIVSCIYAILLYKAEKMPMVGKKAKGTNKQIFSIAIPIAISSYIRSALMSIENILVPRGLRQFGQTSGEALSQYGMIKGMAMPLLYFPSAILSAFANLLVPEISAANALNSKKRIDYIVNKCFKVTLIFAFLIMGIFICFYKEIGLAFYKDAKVGSLLMIFAPLVPLMYLDMVVDSILKGLNQQMSSMKYNTADSAIRALIIFFLVPLLGMKGYVIMLYFGTIFNALLSINRLIVVSKVRFRMIQWVFLPCVAITMACLFTKYFLHTGVFLSMTMVCICYIVILMFMSCITKRDWAWAIHVFYKK